MEVVSAGPSSLLILPLASLGFLLLYHGTSDVVLIAGISLLRALTQLSVLFALATPQWLAIFLGGVIFMRLIVNAIKSKAATRESPSWGGPGRVLLFPSRTTHSRLFPEKHSFSYSYLTVGIPVGWEGVAGGMVSAGLSQEKESSGWLPSWSASRKGWYNVNAGDYLERGSAHLGLRGKLDSYLKSQGADPKDYPHAYLITAARFLGYHFNPVSFWYLYGSDQALTAMILEVNNTFGERRMYFLKPDDAGPAALEESADTDRLETKRAFKQSWPKDFHVSPFNSRKGSYAVSANDVLEPLMQGRGPINITLNMRSSKGHGKLVARLFSNGPALDPTEMSAWQKIKFLASWWWVGFVTFPRIVKEAAALFFRLKLHVWYRPEPLKQSIGRLADDVERDLELVFRRYLRYLVHQSKEPLLVRYVPSGVPDARTELMSSPGAERNAAGAPELELKVLTPAFYSRFVYYAHDSEALFCEFQENCTIWLSKPNLIPRLVFKKPFPPLDTSHFVDFIYFSAIKGLRRRPEPLERPLTSSSTTTKPSVEAVDIREFRISSMDAYVLAEEDGRTRRLYRGAVMKLFIADRIGLGYTQLLDLERLALQTCLAWVLSAPFTRVISQVALLILERLGT